MPSFSILNRGREVFYIHCLLGWHILLHQLLINMISSRPILEGIPAEDSKHVARSCVYRLEPFIWGTGAGRFESQPQVTGGTSVHSQFTHVACKAAKMLPASSVFIHFNNFKNPNFDLVNKKNKRTFSTHS
ncbi:unnamed protein product [Rangifer tarandus platyrhynchus]|uniref:Uncharacterized protein n=2 Tax=Rangifer tarandus platyrhynchus TaxID=3082113 RepID=A0AC59Z3C0_RANTA|nr:unnamed protein product [Rangifer tarandus platyrhynchus]